MHKSDLNRVVFYSINDASKILELKKGEIILKNETKIEYTNINDILELYNIKKFLDNNIFLESWLDDEIKSYKKKVIEYETVIGRFMSTINDSNFTLLYEMVALNYIRSFWELINNSRIFKNITKEKFNEILQNEPHLINTVLTFRNIVENYDKILKDFLLNYIQSAEILLNKYEVKSNFNKKSEIFLPKYLTLENKKLIIENYLNSDKANLNYIEIIINMRNSSDFSISDRLRLEAKRLYKKEFNKLFSNKNGLKYGVSISFKKDIEKIKNGYVDDNLISHHFYSLDFIEKNNDPYTLFLNFKFLFEYLDEQNRIELVNKKSELGTLEKIIGIESINEYKTGITFSLKELTSQHQIFGYSNAIKKQNISIEEIIHSIFTKKFPEKYEFASNAKFSIPTAVHYFEKIRSLAPEFESILKQYKLFVEEKNIDFELLQISSAPSKIKDIPSLNSNKYIYLNEKHEAMVISSHLFFSDQTSLTYVNPYKDNDFNTFFDLLANQDIKYSNYEEYQKRQINYLIDQNLIFIDENDFIQILNFERILVLKDLRFNEVGSYYHYPENFKEEIEKMKNENIIFFESTLFTKSEQAYYSYYLDKKDFTNGLDLRNSYSHGTQPNNEEDNKHLYNYFIYLKLIILALLKIEDDLKIYFSKEN